MDCVIRAAVEGDETAIIALIRELAVYERIEDQMTTDMDGMREALFVRREAEALVIETDGAAVGYAIYFHNFSTFKGRAGLYLEDIYIRPEHRGKGYGSAVFEYLIALAEERGCARMEWACLRWNEPSLKFHRQMGAEALDEWVTFRLALRSRDG